MKTLNICEMITLMKNNNSKLHRILVVHVGDIISVTLPGNAVQFVYLFCNQPCRQALERDLVYS